MSDTAEDGPPQTSEISRLTDDLFRQEEGKLISVLSGIFGINRLQLAEDVVQESLIRALRTWPYTGVPKNPAAWLTQTAKNLALDLIRREKLFHDKEPQIIASMEQWPSESSESPMFENEIRDGRLRLMFACCHPLLPPEAQTALALKVLCGFGVGEIAKAFLTSEAAIAKRLTRARQRIRELHIPFEIPAGDELSNRLDGVLQTLYLLFNEGNILRLKEQDRLTWDQTMIARGMFHLSKSADGDELSTYHLQAAIAACHCVATNYESTDWRKILSLYDQLLELDNSPIVALNRTVAVANVHGPAAGIDAVEAIENGEQLRSYYLLYAVLGEFEKQLNHFQAAIDNFRKALELTELTSEQSFLSERLRDSEERSLRIVA